MCVFAYLRVSTNQQTVENQRLEIQNAGYSVDYWYADEGVSGSVLALQRPQFTKMLEMLRPNETIVCSKLDRLGRCASDILNTVQLLSEKKIKIIVLQLGNIDLTSPTGKLLITMLSAVAELEKSLLVERTMSGLERAKAQGKKLGRPSKTTDEQKREIVHRKQRGESISKIAREFGVSRATILGVCGKYY